MKTYLIDGNNLIGKIKSLYQLQKKDKHTPREKLVLMVERFFAGKKVQIYIFYDGYQNISIPTLKARIVYSQNRPADDYIKKQIENSKNPKQSILVSFDNNLIQFARVCGCEVIKSEFFAKELSSSKKRDEESERTKTINEDEIKRMFGV